MLTIQDRVSEIIANHFSYTVDKVKPEQKFVADLQADCFDFVEILMDLEDEFGIEIPDEEAEKLTTVGEAIAYVEKAGVKA